MSIPRLFRDSLFRDSGSTSITIKIPATLPNPWGKKGSRRFASKSPLGFAVELCASRWINGLKTGPGNQHVLYRWKEYEEVKTSTSTTTETVNLSWTDDVRLAISPDAVSITVTINLFNGQKKIELGQKLGEEYYSLEYDKQGGGIVLKPCIPDSLHIP